MSVGVPQPSFAIGPIRNVPCCGGKIVRRSLMIRGAFATTSVGNMIPLIAPVRTPSMSGSRRIVRLRPSSPPTPMSMKPKPSWMPAAELGGDDHEQREAGRAVGHSWS